MEPRYITFALWLLASVAMLLAALNPGFLLGFAFEAWVFTYVLPLAAVSVASLYASGWWMLGLRILATPIALWDLILLGLASEGGAQGQPTAFGSVKAMGMVTLILALVALYRQPARRSGSGL